MSRIERILSGRVFAGTELAPVRADIVTEDGTIRSLEENPKAPDLWILPALFNAHTHLGDTVAMDCRAEGDLAALVTPPTGLKHRILAATSRADLVAGMRASIAGMVASGTAGCADFREGGADGAAALREAAAGQPFRPVVFGREGGELSPGAEGFGISSARDVPDLERQVAAARMAGRKIAFHAGERDKGDVDAALAFDPDLIVHATHATRAQLRRIADAGIPVAVCPRSNWILGVTSSAKAPPLALMQELGCTVWLGTDNAMFVPPDLGQEMAFASTVYRMDPAALLRAAVGGSALAGSPHFIVPGAKVCAAVIDPRGTPLAFSRDPLASLAKRAPFGAVGTRVFNSYIQ